MRCCEMPDRAEYFSTMATMIALSGILFTGDSDIEGWATAAEFPKSVNVGVGGATCGDVAKKAEGYISTYSPREVVLVCGENDLAYGASVAKTMKRLTKAVDRLASGGARVIFIGTKPEPSTKSLHKKYRKYDQKVRALTRDGNLYTFIDSYGGFEALGNPNSLYKGDKLHLSEEGYASGRRGPRRRSTGLCASEARAPTSSTSSARRAARPTSGRPRSAAESAPARRRTSARRTRRRGRSAAPSARPRAASVRRAIQSAVVSSLD